MIFEEDDHLKRDLLAESMAKKIFNESIKRHMMTSSSPLRKLIDPFKMFPLELQVWNDIYKATVEACNFYLHNARKAELESVILIRNQNLSYSAWRLEFRLPLVWMTGNYFL